MPSKQLEIYTVSQVNSLVKTTLSNNLPGRLAVSGEITNWQIAGSGHCYFSLKDEKSVLTCVMWKSAFQRLRFAPENGMAVLAAGSIDVYHPQGRYQFYVESIQPAGRGALQLAFEQMRKCLESEGLFKDEYKKPLPEYPQRIGILTSWSGAAVHDIKDSIHNRWGCVKLFLYPVAVQGDGAAGQIAAGIRQLNQRNKKLKLDLLIVGRGGGSLEDLWPFNEEVLARAIFESEIPVISAVGHEVDFTIADLVADARASTPTKAGIIAVPDAGEVLAGLEDKQRSLSRNVRQLIGLAKERLATVSASVVFRNRLLPVNYRQQQLDELQQKLTVCAGSFLSQAERRLQIYYEDITRIEPHRLLGGKKVELTNLANHIAVSMKTVINSCTIRLTAEHNKLGALDPKSVLKRGYSITRNKTTGSLIKTAGDVQRGDIITTELADKNLVESKVTKK